MAFNTLLSSSNAKPSPIKVEKVVYAPKKPSAHNRYILCGTFKVATIPNKKAPNSARARLFGAFLIPN